MNEFVTKSLEKEIEALNEENAKMEFVLNKLGLLDEKIFKKYEKFLTLQNELGAEECSPICLKMNFLDTEVELLKKKIELQKRISIFDEYFEIMKETDVLGKIESELEKGESHLERFKSLTESEINELQTEIDKYKKLLTKIGEKTSPTTNKSVLIHIYKKLEEISSLKEQVKQLEMEVDIYEGLSPNLFEAKEQLKNLLIECDELKSALV